MDICDYRDYTWETYPILFLNLGKEYTYGYSLSEYIKERVRKLAKQYGILYDSKLCMDETIWQTFSAINQGVVILMDDYDVPIMETYFNDVAKSRLNEETIEGFFGSLKRSSCYIHFTFIFGATKVTTVGQTRNIISDLTRREEYSDLIGFTEEEIMKTYKERLAEIVHERNLENVTMLFEKILHPYYNSYRFTRFGTSVFNPLSITQFLLENPKNPKPYWADKVYYSDFSEHTVKKFSNNTINLLFGQNHAFKSDETLNDKLNRDNVMLGDTTELAKILFQTGHMTIKEPASPSSYCDLGVVNEEAIVYYYT